jgi:hypothetical protein
MRKLGFDVLQGFDTHLWIGLLFQSKIYPSPLWAWVYLIIIAKVGSYQTIVNKGS